MIKLIVAMLCGTSLAGSVYMAGWGSQKCLLEDEACCMPAEHDAANDSAMGMTPISTAGKVDPAIQSVLLWQMTLAPAPWSTRGKFTTFVAGSRRNLQQDPEKYVKALEANPGKYGVAQK